MTKHTEERTETHECDCTNRETHACDCISRQAVLREFTCLSDDAFVINRKIQEIVKQLPSVEPERKSGKWIRAIDPDVNAWTGGHTCSECGRACVQMSMNFCANCGAKMEVDNG